MPCPRIPRAAFEMESSIADDVDAGVEVDRVSVGADGEGVVTDHASGLGRAVGGTRPYTVRTAAVSVMGKRVGGLHQKYRPPDTTSSI